MKIAKPSECWIKVTVFQGEDTEATRRQVQWGLGSQGEDFGCFLNEEGGQAREGFENMCLKNHSVCYLYRRGRGGG